MPEPNVYELPYFGDLDLTDLGDYYDTEIEFNGRLVQLDLNFDDRETTIDKLDAIKDFLGKLKQQDQRNKGYIRTDYEEVLYEDSVHFYLNFHLEEIGEEELIGLVGPGDEDLPVEEQLLDKIELVRIGFYPDEDGFFAICDYSFGREITNYILVISVNKKGELLDMTVES
jgi:hypothetical protein